MNSIHFQLALSRASIVTFLVVAESPKKVPFPDTIKRKGKSIEIMRTPDGRFGTKSMTDKLAEDTSSFPDSIFSDSTELNNELNVLFSNLQDNGLTKEMIQSSFDAISEAFIRSIKKHPIRARNSREQ